MHAMVYVQYRQLALFPAGGTFRISPGGAAK